jgi:hypothetical protein
LPGKSLGSSAVSPIPDGVDVSWAFGLVGLLAPASLVGAAVGEQDQGRDDLDAVSSSAFSGWNEGAHAVGITINADGHYHVGSVRLLVAESAALPLGKP